jgi:hypothetical protein
MLKDDFDFDSIDEELPSSLAERVLTMWVDANLHLKGLTNPKGVTVGTSLKIAEALERVMERVEPFEKQRHSYTGTRPTLESARLTLACQVKEWERINKLPWLKRQLILISGEDERGLSLDFHPRAYSDDVEKGVCGRYWGWKAPFSWEKRAYFGELCLFKVGITRYNNRLKLNISQNRIELYVWRFNLMIRIGFWGIM